MSPTVLLHRRQCRCRTARADGHGRARALRRVWPLPASEGRKRRLGIRRRIKSGRIRATEQVRGRLRRRSPHFSCCELFCSRCAYMFCGFTSFCRIFDTAVCNVGGSPPLRWGGPHSARETSRQPCRRRRTPKIPRTRQGVWSVDESLHHCTAVGRAPSGRRQKGVSPSPFGLKAARGGDRS